MERALWPSGKRALQLPEITQRESPRAQPKHNPITKTKALTNPIGRSLALLCPATEKGIPRESLLAVFEGRASFAVIRSWRFGYSYPPNWAIDLLKAKLYDKAQHLQALSDRLPRRERKPSNALNIWRERMASEKEKARLAGLQKEIDSGES